jgi:hypothetical protein
MKLGMPTGPRGTINVAVKEAALRAQMVVKRLAIFSAILILSSGAALAQSSPHSTHCPHPLFSDAILMTKAGLSDAPIATHVSARRGHLDSIGAAGTTTMFWAKTMQTPLDAAAVDQDPVE